MSDYDDFDIHHHEGNRGNIQQIENTDTIYIKRRTKTHYHKTNNMPTKYIAKLIP